MKIPFCWFLCSLVINWCHYMILSSMSLLFRTTKTWHKYDFCDMMEVNLIGWVGNTSAGIFEDYSQSYDLWKLVLGIYFGCTAFSSVPWYFNLRCIGKMALCCKWECRSLFSGKWIDNQEMQLDLFFWVRLPHTTSFRGGMVPLDFATDVLKFTTSWMSSIFSLVLFFFQFFIFSMLFLDSRQIYISIAGPRLMWTYLCGWPSILMNCISCWLLHLLGPISTWVFPPFFRKTFSLNIVFGYRLEWFFG